MQNSTNTLLAATVLAALTATAQAQNADPAPAALPPADEVSVGQTYLKETFRDWQLRCVKQEEGVREPCQMYQLLRNENGAPVAEFTLVALPEGSGARAGATVITPLQTLLTQNLVVALDPDTIRQEPFDFCTTVGCYSQLAFSTEEVAKMKAGTEAKVRIVSVLAPETPVVLSTSLLGFTAAFDQLAARVDEEVAEAAAAAAEAEAEAAAEGETTTTE